MAIIENKTFDDLNVADSASMTRTLTQEEAEMSAVVSSDFNPTSRDAHWAARLLQSQTIGGHGLWGGTLFSALLGTELPGPGTVHKKHAFVFHRPIQPGDTVTLTVTVQQKIDANKHVIFNCKAVNQSGDLVIDGTAEVLAPPEKITLDAASLPEIRVRHQHHVFEKLIETVRETPPVTVAVCHPCDEVSLGGAVEAARQGIIIPLLVGPRDKIHATAKQFDFDIDGLEIVTADHSHGAAERAVSLCRSGTCEALMKGSLHTDEMMHEVARRDTGLRTGRRISHIFVMDVPTYPKPLYITDAAINIYPTLEDKVDILKNCIDLVQVMGVAKPHVAILSALETVSPKIQSTIEAAALCKMADRGQISGALLDGPLAFDNAISAKAARIKKITSPVAGQADILLVPDMEAGNMLAKQLSYLAESDAAGLVLGARVPIVLTSRADSAKARLASCAVAALYAQARRQGQKKLMTGQ